MNLPPELKIAITEIDFLSSPRKYLAEVLQAICNSMGYRFGSVIEVDEQGNVSMVSSYNLPQDYPEQVSNVDESILSSPSGEAIQTGKIVVVNDTLSDPRLAPWYNLVRTCDLKTIVWVPLKTKGRVFGTYNLYDNKKRKVPEDELQTLEQIAVVISIAIVSNQYLDKLNSKTKDFEKEIIRRKHVEKELRRSEERYRTFIEQSSQGIWCMEFDEPIYTSLPVDEQVRRRYQYGYISECNTALARMYGHTSAEDMIGKRYQEFYGSSYDEQNLEAHQAFIDSNYQINNVESQEVDKEGNPTYFINNAVGIIEDEYLVRVWGTQTDITDRKRAEQKLQKTLEELERSNKELERFAYIASHDLQEPLRKIQAFGDRLQKKYQAKLEELGQDYLARMLNATKRMQTLINDLLTYSRVTTQAKPFDKVDLSETVKEVVDDFQFRIEETNGRLEIGELPILEADPTQMRQLLQNLIDNCLKFHKKEESPIVKVHGKIVDQNYKLFVEDNGIGFDEKHRDRIFTIFQRLHGRLEYEGTGIGLAVCRKIMERHGGEITARSKPGQGSTFIITLPLKHNGTLTIKN